MSRTPTGPIPQTTPVPARRLKILAPVLGLLTVGMILLYGIVFDAPGGGVFTFLPVFVPVIVLAFSIGNPSQNMPGRLTLMAMPPVSISLLTATLVFGSYACSQAVGEWWWIIGGLLNAVPFLITGLLAARHTR